MTAENAEPALPNPRVGQHPPVMEHAFAALGWLQRAAQAVGSVRFAESLERAAFYLDKTAGHSHTPGEQAVLAGLWAALSNLTEADVQARALLAQGCSGMMVADVAEFVDLIEDGEKNFPEV